MRCSYCYNPDIVKGKGKLSFEEALAFLRTRNNLLDGVVLSGGECTLHADISDLILEIKKLGLLVKIDTNGSSPERIDQFIQLNLIDYVALDFKSLQNNFYAITSSGHFSKFQETLKMLIGYNFPFEVRSTLHSDLHSQDDLQEMVKFLEHEKYKGTYYLQNFVSDTATLGNMKKSNREQFQLENIRSTLPIQLRN